MRMKKCELNVTSTADCVIWRNQVDLGNRGWKLKERGKKDEDNELHLAKVMVTRDLLLL